MVFCFSLLFYSCNGQFGNRRSNAEYVVSKKEFNDKLVDHFPRKLSSPPTEFINSKNSAKNTVGFMLYEYDVSIEKIDSVVAVVEKIKIAKYNSKENCLLIVNRFETVDTYKNRKDIIIADSTKINQKCYELLYPIPNFINYKVPNNNSDLKLEGNFDIYVLEAKSGNHFKEFDLQPNPQMPSEWKNGYSKGIAVSKEKHTIIYWSIIW